MIALLLTLAAVIASSPSVETVPWAGRTVTIVERDLTEDAKMPTGEAIERIVDQSTCAEGCSRVALRFGDDGGPLSFSSGSVDGDKTRYGLAVDGRRTIPGRLLVGRAGDPLTAADAIAFPMDGTRTLSVRTIRDASGTQIRRLTIVWSDVPAQTFVG